jgi:hypothetical protein
MRDQRGQTRTTNFQVSGKAPEEFQGLYKIESRGPALELSSMFGVESLLQMMEAYVSLQPDGPQPFFTNAARDMLAAVELELGTLAQGRAAEDSEAPSQPSVSEGDYR